MKVIISSDTKNQDIARTLQNLGYEPLTLGNHNDQQEVRISDIYEAEGLIVYLHPDSEPKMGVMELLKVRNAGKPILALRPDEFRDGQLSRSVVEASGGVIFVNSENLQSIVEGFANDCIGFDPEVKQIPSRCERL